jgi:hypothetical protein
MEEKEEIKREEVNSRALYYAREAKRILSEPLLQSYFESQWHACCNAFFNLPIGATLEQYQAVHSDLRAAVKLKLSLENYIKEYAIVEQHEKQAAAEGV